MKITNQLKNIKKGTKLITKHLGIPVRATSMESIKQGRGFKKILLVDVKGSDIGLFDEIGSIYVDDIVEVLTQEVYKILKEEYRILIDARKLERETNIEFKLDGLREHYKLSLTKALEIKKLLDKDKEQKWQTQHR